MRKFYKPIISFFVAFAIIFSFIPRSFGLLDFVLGKVCDWFAKNALTQAEINEYKTLLRNCWQSSTCLQQNLILVSGDELWSAAAEWSGNGVPCEVVWTSSVGGTGVAGYWIVCIGEPYNMSGASLRDANETYIGRHLGTHTDYIRYYYSTDKASSAYLHDIYNKDVWIETHLSNLVNYLDGVEGYLSNLVSSSNTIISHIDGLESSSNTIIGHIDGIESSLNTIIGHIDGIESSLSSIDTKFTTLNSRIIKTVNGSTYTIADLGYNAWQRLIDIAGYVDGVESSLSSILSANNLTNTRLSTIIDRQDTSQQTLEGIYDALYEINDELVASNLNPVLVSSYLVDSEGDDYPRVTIPYESAVDIIGYLNDHFYSRRVSVISNSGSIASRWFVRADLSENNYIRVYCSAQNNSTGSVYGYYLCDSHHNIIISANPTYLDKLNNLDTKVTQLTGIISPILGLAAAVANIDLNVGELNLNLDSLFDDLNLNLDDLNLNLDDLNLNIDGLSDSISALPSPTNIVPYIDQLESYTDGLENALSTINTNVTYTSDGITYSVGYLSYVTADYSKKIYDHLSNIDIADDSHIMPLIENYSDVVLDTFGRGERTIQLFTMGWGDYHGMQILPRQWSEVVDWFDMYNEGGILND